MGRPPKPIDKTASLTGHYGWKIRTLREARNWTLADLGQRIALSLDAVSKLEHGKSAPDDRTARLLDQALGTGDYFTEHAPLVRKERVPGAARSLAEAEREATQIYIYEPNLITGLFQTEEYARAFVMVCLQANEVDAIVADRLRRQEVLEKPQPPRVMLMIDEGALRRPVGGPEVLRGQLDKLEVLMQRHNIAIQAIPASTTEYPGLQGGFSLLSFTEGPDVAYVEGPVRGTGQYVETPDTLDPLSETYDLIRSAAQSSRETAELIQKIRECL